MKSVSEMQETSEPSKIRAIMVTPPRGKPASYSTVGEAIGKLSRKAEANNRTPVVRYEIEVLYDTSDRVSASITDREDVIDFLRGFLPPSVDPA